MSLTLKSELHPDFKIRNDKSFVGSESLECDEEYDEAYPMIIFIGELDNMVIFKITPENGISAHDWNKLADGCDTFSDVKYDWKPANGSMCINVQKNGMVLFSIAKFGDGNGGTAEVSFPSVCCATAFRNAAILTDAWFSSL